MDGDGMGGKYAALTSWPSTQDPRAIRLSFGELEAILGTTLPKSYLRYPGPWYGSQPSTIAAAIGAAGWRARFVDLSNSRLTLEPIATITEVDAKPASLLMAVDLEDVTRALQAAAAT